VARGHHACGSVEHGAEVVVAAQFRLSGGDPHPHWQLQLRLRRNRRIDSRTGGGEYGAHAVARVVEHSSIVGLDGLAYDVVVGL
jgi:hypothetical protein